MPSSSELCPRDRPPTKKQALFHHGNGPHDDAHGCTQRSKANHPSDDLIPNGEPKDTIKSRARAFPDGNQLETLPEKGAFG